MNILEKKIIDSKITVGIIGMGYVGLELLINLDKKKIRFTDLIMILGRLIL